MRTISVFDAPRELVVNQNVDLVYPSSKDGEPTPRRGRVEKITETGVTVETPQGYRTFNFARITGGTINLH